MAEREYPPPSGEGVFSSGSVLSDFDMTLKIAVFPLEIPKSVPRSKKIAPAAGYLPVLFIFTNRTKV